MATETTEIETLANREYKWGFVTDIESDTLPPGLTEDTVRFISAKKNEPEWMLEWRLKAFKKKHAKKSPEALQRLENVARNERQPPKPGFVEPQL